MNVLVIHNTSSGFGDSSIYDFMRAYAQEGDSITIRTFAGNISMPDLLSDANNFDFVVACGGDGTIASIAYELRYTNIPILPFPAGTANLLALNLLMPEELHAIAKIANEALTMSFDLGELETRKGSFGFDLMAGCGYDHIIMQEASANKRLLGPMAYFQAAAANPTPQHSDFILTIDGKTVITDGIGVIIANFSKIQFDLMVSDANLPRDGAFDVVVLKTENALELLPVLFAKVVDHTGNLSKKLNTLEVYRGRDITIEANPAMLVEFDGEPTTISTPIRMRNLHNAARFIVSEECIKHFTEDLHIIPATDIPVTTPTTKPILESDQVD